MAFGGGKSFITASKGDGSLAFYLSYKTDENHFKNLDSKDKTQCSQFKMILLIGVVCGELFDNAENSFHARSH